jgi:hypothetical protein
MLAASLERCARLCDLPAHHIRQAAANGSLPYVRMGVRKIVLLDDLQRWLRECQQNGGSHVESV